MCYVPDPNETPTRSPSMPETPDLAYSIGGLGGSLYTPVDLSRLPLPAIYLGSDRNTCAICQENYTPPFEGQRILLKADILRVLGCGHAFHVRALLVYNS